jgi:hypothetical protein
MVWVDTGTLPRSLFKLKLRGKVRHLAKAMPTGDGARTVGVRQAKQSAMLRSHSKHAIVSDGANRIATVEVVSDNYGATIDV